MSALESAFRLVRRTLERHPTGGGLGALLGLGIVLGVTGLALLAFDPPHMADAVMLYLLGVVAASLWLSAHASLATALLSVMAFEFVFIPPHMGFVMADVRHLATFGVMLLVAVLINRLASRARDQAVAARDRERRTAALYEMGRELAGTAEGPALVASAARHVGRYFGAEVVVLAPDKDARLQVTHATAPELERLASASVVDWVFRNGREAGHGEVAFPQETGLFLPLATPEHRLGVVGVFLADPERLADSEERALLDAFVAQLAIALERTRLAEEAASVRVVAATERLRNALLSSVSHDLRTPLGAIEGAASTLLALDRALDPGTRRDLIETVHEEARRLGRRVANLLDMTRLEAGALSLRREWQPLEEVVGSALGQLDELLAGREVRTDLPASLPPVPIDAVLVGQVLVNLLENAAKYSPPASPIEVGAASRGDRVELAVADRGPGVPAGQETLVFEKFQRASSDPAIGGVGLGLAICRAIVEAHGGRIWVESRGGGGAVFRLTLPAPAAPDTTRHAAATAASERRA